MGSAGRKVRYGVVGLGNLAQVAVLPAFEHAKESSELAALVSSDKAKLETLGERYGVSLLAGYDDLEAVIAEGKIDAVYVVVPNTLHRAFTERAAKAGAHVLCEKPMAVTVTDCEAMIAATKACGVKLMIAYRLHFDPANLRVIERIAKGDIGEPRIVSSVFAQQVRQGDVRTKRGMGGGALYDMGVYCINAARFLFREEPSEVAAQRVSSTDSRFKDVDEMTSAILRFPGGQLAQLTASQGASDVSELRIVGTKGSIRLDPAYGYDEELCEHFSEGGRTVEQTFTVHDQFAPELVYFSRCILEGREPEPSGEEGLADVRVLQAILKSAQTGRTVQLPPFHRSVRPSSDLAMRMPPVGQVATVQAPSPAR
jgi:predicted dehydrogenase